MAILNCFAFDPHFGSSFFFTVSCFTFDDCGSFSTNVSNLGDQSYTSLLFIPRLTDQLQPPFPVFFLGGGGGGGGGTPPVFTLTKKWQWRGGAPTRYIRVFPCPDILYPPALFHNTVLPRKNPLNGLYTNNSNGVFMYGVYSDFDNQVSAAPSVQP
jgi:hypothetical protein